jgi:hypothetical protein
MLTFKQTLDAQALSAGPFCALVWNAVERRCEKRNAAPRDRAEIEEMRDRDHHGGEMYRGLGVE